MRNRRFFWRLVVGYAGLMAVVLAGCVVLMYDAIRGYQTGELDRHLHATAVAIAHVIDDLLDGRQAEKLDRIAKSITERDTGGLRVTIIDPSGVVLGDSEADPHSMANHADRPEVQQALREGSGRNVRQSATVHRTLVYVAIRVGDASTVRGFVRIAMPTWRVDAVALATQRLVWTIAGVGLLIMLAVAAAMGTLWSRPINRLVTAARSMSRGDLTVPLDTRGTDELALLARSLNRMRNRISAQLGTIDRQRRTLEAMIAQLHEGVIVVGPDGQVVLINPAAARVLRHGEAAGVAGLVGQPVQQCIPQHDVQRLLLPRATMPGDSANGTDKRFEEERLSIDVGGRSVNLLARASDIALPGAQAEAVSGGRLLVLTDVTELTRTIQMKTDFVANASHELRTPLSAIHGAVETLLKMDPARESAAMTEFLGMVDRHVRRLEAMVADLLSLSRLESPAASFEATHVHLADVLGELRDRFSESIESKRLEWSAECQPDGLLVQVSPYLLGLILDNLVENAIKFTEPGGRVSVRCARHSNGVDVIVSDTGCGIPPEEQDRVFERFYQVERARSGPLRGTGLGLSIVRHAVTAMRGAVRLESAVGRGTSVTIMIPNAPAGGDH